MNRRTDGIRPHFNLSGERGLSKQGMYGMDLPDAGNDDEVSESEGCLERSEQSSDDDMKEDDQNEEDDHAEEDVAEEIETEDEETEDPGAHAEAPVRVTSNPADPTPEERVKHDTNHLPYRHQ